MVKSTLILFQIVLASSAILANSVKSGVSKRGLIFIGDFDENYYFISPNSASWNSANADCINQLGGLGHLLAIETQAEWDFLKVALENFGFGTSYWTSGMFDPSQSAWRWTVNNEILGEWAPWGPNFPSPANQLLRVLIHYIGRDLGEWRTVPGTQLHRYICELRR